MTRFKEGRRIEAAVNSRNGDELKWALSYCRMRLSIAVRKDHRKHWLQLAEKVTRALRALDLADSG